MPSLGGVPSNDDRRSVTWRARGHAAERAGVSGPELPSKPQSLSIEAIHDSPPSRVDPEVNAAVGEERADLEPQRLKIQNELLRARLKDRKQDREQDREERLASSEYS